MSTKRERLLDWLRSGDPADVPVMMGPGFEMASAYLDKDQRDVTWADAIRVAEETGTHNIACVAQPMPFDAVEFLADVELAEQYDTTDAGVERRTWRIKTPEGTLREVQEFPKDTGSYHREFFVKGDEDLPVYADFIRRTTSAVVTDPAVRRRVDAFIKAAKAEVGGALPTEIHVFCPAVELMSSIYVDQANAIYAVYGHPDLMEELMDAHWGMVQVWLELAAANDIDIYNFAINGYEWLSPDLYERYMVPQAKRICDFARDQGKLSWLHTCGKLKEIAEVGTYRKMGLDIVESLSAPPTGDIDDLRETREHIGYDIATRGGINCELFYEGPDVVRKQAEHVLDCCEGFRHMPGDTNASYPAYPRTNIQPVIDVVRDRGRLFV